MTSFFDTPIPNDQIFANAPSCRTRREATQHYLDSTHFSEPQPPTDSAVKMLHQITHAFSMGKLIGRQVVLQNDGCTIRKSVRIGRSNLGVEKRHLELVKAKTSVPVPPVRHYYLSEEFEHLTMDVMPGMTLERAWPTLSPLERESIADEVASLVEQLRKLHSPCIEAALLQRQPFRAGLRGVTAFNMERIKKFMSNEHIVAYVHERSEAVDGELNVFTHGDLDWGNIFIADKRVCGIIDLESSGFFPPYWEWITLKSLSRGLPDGSWFRLLEQRLRREDCLGWKGMWEVERLIMALDLFSQWALAPAGRDGNRSTGWAEVVRILGPRVGEPPPVAYAMTTEHPWWLESDMEVTRKGRREQGESSASSG